MQFFNTVVTDQAKMLVNQTLDSTFLSEGRVVREFESALEQQLGLRHAVCVNSGTSALHLALIAAGVKQGDEVITSPQTFIATALAILYVGATPVFADINPYTGNLDSKSVGKKITDKTRAILSVDWAGCPSNDEWIDELSAVYFIPTIQDAAHSLGATYKGNPIGSKDADFTCFSTQAIKSLTTGDGGIVCAWGKKDYNHLRRLRWFGIDREKDLPDELGERQYTLTEVGFKYHLSDFNAALGLGNLVGFHERLARRRAIAKRYFTELANVTGLELMRYESDRESSYWLYPLLVENRLDFVRMMKDKGIPTSVVHQRIDKHPILAPNGINEDLVGMAYFDSHQIHIPIHSDLTDEDVDLIVNTIKGGW